MLRPRTIGGVSTIQAQTPVSEYSKDTGTSGASSTSLGVLVVAASAWKVEQLESCFLVIAQAWELAKNDWVTSARTWSSGPIPQHMLTELSESAAPAVALRRR